MKTSDDIHHENLLLLIKEAGGDDSLAERYGCDVSYIRQLKSRSRDSKTGTPKGIGKISARKLERCLNKPAGWLDQDHSPTGTTSPPSPHREGSTVSIAPAMVTLDLPVECLALWDQMQRINPARRKILRAIIALDAAQEDASALGLEQDEIDGWLKTKEGPPSPKVKQTKSA